MRHIAPISMLALSLLLLLVQAGCTESSSERRTWQPSDHAQPPGREVDPARQARTAAGTPRSEPTGDSNARAAAVLFRMMCASCHGLDGKGQGPALPPGATPPDFTDADWQGSRADQAIIDTIRQGRGVMPGFGDQIAGDGITALIGHIRGFAAAPAAAPAAAAAAAPAPAP